MTQIIAEALDSEEEEEVPEQSDNKDRVHDLLQLAYEQASAARKLTKDGEHRRMILNAMRSIEFAFHNINSVS